MNKQIISSNIVNIRSEQNCYGCGRKFPKGSSMESMACKINNHMCRKYFCTSCHKIMNKKPRDYFDKMSYGELLLNALLIEGKR